MVQFTLIVHSNGSESRSSSQGNDTLESSDTFAVITDVIQHKILDTNPAALGIFENMTN